MVYGVDMLLWNQEDVHGRLGVEVVKGNETLIFILIGCPFLMPGNGAEQTFRHFFNLFFISSTVLSNFTVSWVPLSILRITMVLSSASRWPRIRVNRTPSLSALDICTFSESLPSDSAI